MTLSYEDVREWRDVCEYLDDCWYKFDDAAPFLLCTPKGRDQRQLLWDTWKIQIIRFGEHPVLEYKHDRLTRRAFRNDKGWRLLPGWEYKIDFLEQVYILGRDGDRLPKPWQDALQAWLRTLKCPIGLDCAGMMQDLQMNRNHCPNIGTCKDASRL